MKKCGREGKIKDFGIRRITAVKAMCSSIDMATAEFYHFLAQFVFIFLKRNLLHRDSLCTKKRKRHCYSWATNENLVNIIVAKLLA